MKRATVLLCCLFLASCTWTRGLEKPVATHAGAHAPRLPGTLWILPANDHKQTRMIVKFLEESQAFAAVREQADGGEINDDDRFLEAKITSAYTIPTGPNVMSELINGLTLFLTYPWLGRYIDAEHQIEATVYDASPNPDFSAPGLQHKATARRRFETSLYGTGTEVFDQAEELQTRELLRGFVSAMIEANNTKP